MKALLTRGVLFALPLVALLALFERAVLFGVTRCFVGEVAKVNLIMQHRIDPPLVIFGSSNALTAFDAPLLEQLTGLPTYNFGLYGTYFVQYQALVREFAEYTQNGRYVVIAETYQTFRPLTALRGPERFLAYASTPNVAAVIDEIDPPLAWRLRHVPFYSLIVANSSFYGSAMRGYRALLGWQVRDREQQGWLPMNLSWDPSPYEGDHGYSERVAREFAETLALLASRGLTIVLVVTPIESGCQRMVEHFAQHRDTLRTTLGNRGVFLDYSQHPIAGDIRYFYNCGHLNTLGAKEFSRVFATDLAAATNDPQLRRQPAAADTPPAAVPPS